MHITIRQPLVGCGHMISALRQYTTPGHSHITQTHFQRILTRQFCLHLSFLSFFICFVWDARWSERGKNTATQKKSKRKLNQKQNEKKLHKKKTKQGKEITKQRGATTTTGRSGIRMMMGVDRLKICYTPLFSSLLHLSPLSHSLTPSLSLSLSLFLSLSLPLSLKHPHGGILQV